MSQSGRVRKSKKTSEIIDAEALSRRNAELEEEIERLYVELDEATNGILKRGYLFKWRDREISFASKWGLRYFTLRGHLLSYYLDDKDPRPRSTTDLSNCVIRWEGAKKNGQFHVFSIYTGGDASSGLEVGNLLLRLSSESEVEAGIWKNVLEQACNVGRQVVRMNSLGSGEAGAAAESDSSLRIDLPKDSNSGSAPQSPLSSSMMLRRSLSQQSIRRNHSQGSNLSKNLHNDGEPKKGSDSERPRDHPFPASRPLHLSNKSSPLSSDVKQGEQNYRGFFNLGLIIMVLAHLRMVVDEAKKRSLTDLSSTLTGSVARSTADADLRCGILAILGWICSVGIAFLTEKVAATGWVSNAVIFRINVVMCLVNILLPIYSVWTSSTNSGLGMIYLLGSVVLWMKLTSYAHVNSDYRKKLAAWKALDKKGHGGKDTDSDNNAKPTYVDTSYSEVRDLCSPVVQYPANITAPNLLYFIAVPTLCYQLNYPRTSSIRWKHVLTYVSRLIVITLIVVYSCQRFITPILEHSLPAMDKRDLLGVLERLLKLSIPNTYVWLLGFYWFFHLYLNLLAELTMFGDRQFYKDWWNARTLDRYWRLWNLPVHHWVVRHLYYPLTRWGTSKDVATFVAFLFSAALHEVIISVPFRHIGFHAFLGMMAQAPLIYVTKWLDSYFDNSYLSNAFFWIIFCVIGQPMGVILYYYDLWKVGQAALGTA